MSSAHSNIAIRCSACVKSPFAASWKSLFVEICLLSSPTPHLLFWQRPPQSPTSQKQHICSWFGSFRKHFFDLNYPSLTPVFVTLCHNRLFSSHFVTKSKKLRHKHFFFHTHSTRLCPRFVTIVFDRHPLVTSLSLNTPQHLTENFEKLKRREATTIRFCVSSSVKNQRSAANKTHTVELHLNFEFKAKNTKDCTSKYFLKIILFCANARKSMLKAAAVQKSEFALHKWKRVKLCRKRLLLVWFCDFEHELCFSNSRNFHVIQVRDLIYRVNECETLTWFI